MPVGPPEADVARFSGPFLHQALEPDGTLFEMETGPGSARWVPLYAMSPNIPEAVLAHEDDEGLGFGQAGDPPFGTIDPPPAVRLAGGGSGDLVEA